MDSIYIALDFATGKEALAFLDTHELHGAPVKVGMELFYREGAPLLYTLKERGHSIFLDVKVHDIPTTVYRTMKNIATFGVDIVNVHALGGKDMIARAKEGLLTSNGPTPKLLAVTILTSMEEQVMQQELQIENTLHHQVEHLATLSQSSGADGVVCSAHEAQQIKNACGPEFLTVTPGIRLASDDADDQKRVATPARAKALGSDILVIGRSITKANDSKQAYETAIKEWENDAK